MSGVTDVVIGWLPKKWRLPVAILLVLGLVGLTAAQFVYAHARNEWDALQTSQNPCHFTAHAERYPWLFPDLAREKADALGGCNTEAVAVTAPDEPSVSALASRPENANFDTDCRDCPDLVRVPEGDVLIGSPASEVGRDADETQRPARVPTFYISAREITVAQFRAFVRDAERYFSPGCIEMGRSDNAGGGEAPELSWQDPGFPQTDAHPVVCVSNSEATAYVQWLSQRTGKHYRLPTSEEWEYAARAGTTTAYAFGDTLSADQAFFSETVAPVRRGPHPTASLAPNAFGVWDMHGNVAEWTASCGTNLDDATQCLRPIVRGGSWNDPPRRLRSADRSARQRMQRATDLGFRVVRQGD